MYSPRELMFISTTLQATRSAAPIQKKMQDAVNRADATGVDCIICSENTATVTFKPCGHKITCSGKIHIHFLFRWFVYLFVCVFSVAACLPPRLSDLPLSIGPVASLPVNDSVSQSVCLSVCLSIRRPFVCLSVRP